MNQDKNFACFKANKQETPVRNIFNKVYTYNIFIVIKTYLPNVNLSPLRKLIVCLLVRKIALFSQDSALRSFFTKDISIVSLSLSSIVSISSLYIFMSQIVVIV